MPFRAAPFTDGPSPQRGAATNTATPRHAFHRWTDARRAATETGTPRDVSEPPVATPPLVNRSFDKNLHPNSATSHQRTPVNGWSIYRRPTPNRPLSGDRRARGPRFLTLTGVVVHSDCPASARRLCVVVSGHAGYAHPRDL